MGKFEVKLVSKTVSNDGRLAKIINHDDLGRSTTSSVDESIVFGRDSDMLFLLSKVLSVNTKPERSMQLISIVGAGGLGKTTLAQLVYNDSKVKEKFGENIIWVCVSDPFDEVKVAKAILEGKKVDHTKMNNLETLHQSIKESFSDKKFLLVLDDVWDEDTDKWGRLRLCLNVGDPESKILVTTRKEDVARKMCTMSSNILKPKIISNLDCWLLMRHMILQTRTKIDEDLEDIGLKLAERCKGFPLAAKTLGGLMMLKDSVQEWRDVLHNDIWGEFEELEMVDIFPHIFLSYQELPSAFKRCFLILALFPKDSHLAVKDIIGIWMAHQFLDSIPMTKKVGMLKMCQNCLETLVSRSLLEKKGDTMVFMHDIMHDFAMHHSGDELLSILVDDTIEDDSRSESSISKEWPYPKSRKARHLMIGGNINLESIDSEFGKLRSCIIRNVPPNVTSDIVKLLKRVRVLYLEDCELKQVPQNIENLLHLRVLLLSGNPLVELPETIGNLYNLQELFLERLDRLSSLPHSLGKLTNLTNLLPDDLVLEKSPDLVGKLINLQSLGTVQVGAGHNKLALLMDLNQLQGHLGIEFTSDYDDEVDAKNAAIGRKKHIKEFSLICYDSKVTDGVLAALQPHQNLQSLGIHGVLPRWISSLNNLADLEVHRLENLSTLPPLWKLKSLKKLRISRLSALEIIGLDFLGMDDNQNEKFCAFPNLVELEFFDCCRLRGWEDLYHEAANHSINVMPNLEILEFKRCNMFDMLPSRLLSRASSLKKLYIKKKDSLFDFDVKEVANDKAGTLHFDKEGQTLEMTVKNSTKVPTSINYHSYVTQLDIYCAVEPISYLPPMGNLPYLERLTIHEFSNLKFINRNFLGIDDTNKDEEFVVFPNLMMLKICLCYKLEGWEDLRPEDEGKITVMPKLESLQIISCLNFELLPRRFLSKLPPSLKVLDLPDGEPSVNIKGEEVKNGVLVDLPHPPSLEKLCMVGYKGTQLPNWITYLNNLTEVEVDGAKNALSLPALGKLPSLEVLRISNFRVLKFIRKEFLGMDSTTNKHVVAFPKLKELEFSECNELKGWEDIEPEEDPINVMPNLEILKFEGCDMFDELPLRLFSQISSLKELKIKQADSLFDFNIKESANGVGGHLHLRPGYPILEMTIQNHTKVPTSIIYHSYITLLHFYCKARPISHLPPMGELPYLESLYIIDFSSLEFIGRDFLGKDTVAFPELKVLKIKDCIELKEWEDIKEEEEDQITIMPKLRELSITKCRQLEALPHRLLSKATSLKKFRFKYSNDLLAEYIKKDKEFLGRVNEVNIDDEEWSLKELNVDDEQWSQYSSD